MRETSTQAKDGDGDGGSTFPTNKNTAKSSCGVITTLPFEKIPDQG